MQSFKFYKMKTILSIILIFFLVSGNAQETQKKSKKELKAEKRVEQTEKIKSLLDSKTFVFDATNANPMTGNTINLTSNYDVRIQNDSLFSYLPYYGRAYTAAYGGESPMIFDSPIVEYSMEKAKKGFYSIKATVKNKMDNLEFNFNIAETGSATLIVISNNRQSISYYGNIEKTKEETKEK